MPAPRRHRLRGTACHDPAWQHNRGETARLAPGPGEETSRSPLKRRQRICSALADPPDAKSQHLESGCSERRALALCHDRDGPLAGRVGPHGGRRDRLYIGTDLTLGPMAYALVSATGRRGEPTDRRRCARPLFDGRDDRSRGMRSPARVAGFHAAAPLGLGDRSSSQSGRRRRSPPPWDQHRRPRTDYFCFDQGASTKVASTRCRVCGDLRDRRRPSGQDLRSSSRGYRRCRAVWLTVCDTGSETAGGGAAALLLAGFDRLATCPG